jgi:N-acetylglutamate synthase-like GNAT family acetyltransferase
MECKKINKNIKTRYEYYPAIKIGRLAIDEKYQGFSRGNEILASICELIKEISEEIGVKFITVDAYFKACGFYSKNSFKAKRIHNIKKIERKAIRDETTSIFMYKHIEKIKIT